MKFAGDITKLIGRTPLVRINKYVKSDSNLILAKLEQFNPCASIKDRAAVNMINDAEQRRIIKPGATLIEATSGNTGIALAFIAAARDYKLIIVMPDSMSLERQNLLRLFDVKVELTQAHLGMQGAIDRALQIKNEIKGSFLVRQFDNPANTQIHELTTAREIISDTDGKVDIFISGVGTGGTITGVGKKLKENNKNVRIVAVEPASCAVLSGDVPGPHRIQGIGAGFVPSILETDLIDEVIRIFDEEAFEATKDLARSEGILAGISSGAVAVAARKYLKKYEVKSSTVVMVFPDTGERYVSIPNLGK
jgi:cysteine synthase A